VSLRKLIAETPLVKDKSVLEIGTGSGLLSLYCLKFGARKVVATDVNRLAVENARYNADQLGLGERFEVRLVPLDAPGAYSVIGASERFDLIISNPPWEDVKPEQVEHYAYYDSDFGLLRSLVAGLREHLNPDGRALLAYGSADGIAHVQRLCSEHSLRLRILDDRDPDVLPAVFVPGVLLEVSR
jgi:methylase of polypeptide subunit release factors